jgi:hypothetical protein
MIMLVVMRIKMIELSPRRVATAKLDVAIMSLTVTVFAKTAMALRP